MSKKILIIEDDNILQKAVKEALVNAGFGVIQAYDGQEGLEKINQEKPDLIILDLIMPVKTGEWVLGQMSESNILGNYPIIVLTAKGDLPSISNVTSKLLFSRGSAGGFKAKDYLIKSEYSLEKIVERVKEILK